MREIITLQLGHLSNYTATHFWNAQESYFTYSNQEESLIDHNVHWRPGIGSDGSETFLPRTVIYDLKGGFGALRKINALYEPESGPEAASSLWSGQSVLQKQTPVELGAYQQSLDAGTQPAKLTNSSVRYWSDFSRVYYHPKSLVQLYDFELNSTIRPFERFSMGTELFETLDKDQDIVDRDFRPFVEECDRMQGIQTLATMDDAWGGFAAQYLDVLRDEYPKTCIMLWGLQSPTVDVPREKRQLRMSNMAQTLAQTCSTASMVVPLTIPSSGLPQNMAVDPRSSWQVSAAFATAMESSIIESRMAYRAGIHTASMWDIIDGLNAEGNQTLGRLRMSIGSAATAEDEERERNEIDLFDLNHLKASKTKGKKPHVFGQRASLRAPDTGKEEVDDEEDQKDPRARQLVGDPVYRSFDTRLKFPLLDSFPSIYTEGVGHDDISVRTVLSTDTTISPQVKSLKDQTTWSLPLEERETLSSNLADIAAAYQDDWSSGSDEDDDD